jgi:hypothetical protein
VKQAHLREMSKEAAKRVCMSTIVVSPNLLSHTPSTSAMKTPENTKEDLEE